MGFVASLRLDDYRGMTVQQRKTKQRRWMGKEALADGLAGSSRQVKALMHEEECSHQNAAV